MTRRIAVPWLVAILVLAVGGLSLAVAAPTVASAITKSQVKKIAKAQANKAIGHQAAGLSVSHASTSDVASVGLSPVAYAVILADGTLVAADSRGITQANEVKRSISGYCFNVPFAFKTAQATPIYEGGSGAVTAELGITGQFGIVNDCLSTDQVEVATTINATFAAHGFIIWFYN
jgi:hypothetical protein